MLSQTCGELLQNTACSIVHFSPPTLGTISTVNAIYRENLILMIHQEKKCDLLLHWLQLYLLPIDSSLSLVGATTPNAHKFRTSNTPSSIRCTISNGHDCSRFWLLASKQSNLPTDIEVGKVRLSQT